MLENIYINMFQQDISKLTPSFERSQLANGDKIPLAM